MAPPELDHRIEALAQRAGLASDLTDPRCERAYELIEEIADVQGLSPAELVRQGQGSR